MNFVQADVFSANLSLHSFALVYADPPYANCRFRYARKNSSRQWGRNSRADFMRELIARMDSLRAADGACALSMATPELELLPLFPSRRRVLAWVKPYAVFRPGVWPAFAWEPVVIWGNLPGRAEQKASQTPPDWFSCPPQKPSKREGAHENPKPEAVMEWVINMALGPRRGPALDLFAGSCTMARVAERLGMSATAVDLDDYSPDAPLLNTEATPIPDRRPV